MLELFVALLMEGHDVTKLASMAKLKAGRLVREVTDGCLQFLGGMGYTEVNHVITDCFIRIFISKNMLSNFLLLYRKLRYRECIGTLVCCPLLVELMR